MSEEQEEENQLELTESEVALASVGLDEDVPEPEESQEEPSSESKKETVDDTTEPEETPEEEESEPQFTTDDYDLGLSYGLSKEDVDQLGNKETLEKFGQIYDKKILQEKRVKKQSKPEEVEQDEQSTEEVEQEVLGTDDESDSVKFDLSKVDLDEYDGTTQEVFKALDSVQKEVEFLRSRNVALEAQQENSTIEKFGRVLDGMDGEFYGEQYGETSKANQIEKQYMDRRIELAEAVDTLVAGYLAKGKTPPPIETLVRNAHTITYPDRQSEKLAEGGKQRLKKQAARKRGAGARKSQRIAQSEPLDDEEAEIQRIMSATDESYRRMIDENN